MKKILFLALLLAAFLFPARAQRFGSPNSNGDTIYYNITSDSTVEVTYRGDNIRYSITSITIPSTVTHDGTTYTVTGIGSGAFSVCYQATSINLPSTLQYIGDYAFEYCRSVESFVLPNGLKRIGTHAFHGMYSITGIVIPQTVEEIGVGPFSKCGDLSTISVQSGNSRYSSQNGVLFTIDKDTLLQYPCGKSGSYTLPSTVRVIAAEAFAYCYNNITGITFPEGLRAIEYWAFAYCYGLTHVALPSTLERMGPNPFYFCKGLSAFSLSDGSNHFAVRDGVLFSHDMHRLICFPLARHGDYSVPDSVQTIGAYAFAYSYLKSIVLPATVDTVEYFSLATNYCAIYFRGNTPEVTWAQPFGWFGNPQILAPCGQRDAYVQWASDFINDPSNQIGEAPTSYTVHFTYNEEDWGLATVTCHPTSADSAILTATTPLANEWMDPYFIRWGDGNTDNPRTIALSSDTTFSVYFGNRLHYFTVENADGIPIQYWGDPNDGTASVVCNYQTDENGNSYPVYAGHVEVPAMVEHSGVNYEVIGLSRSCFWNCTELTSVVLPNSVTDIADWAFSGCVNLESVTLPDHLTTIGMEAFWGCQSLTSIEMPNTVTSVGPYCFSQCFNLSSATLSESLTEIDTSLFLNTALTTIRIPSSITKIAPGAFYHCWRLDSVILPDHTTSIGYYAFYGCQSLTSIEMPNTVTSVGPFCFSQCINLSSATISESLTEIDTSVFQATALTHIAIPSSITKIGPWAFYDCWHLDSIVLRPTTPPTCTSSTSFYNVDKSIPVHVPCGTLQAYQGWQDFTNIIEDCESIEQAEDGLNIYACECGIVVESTSDEPLRVYDVTGRLILTSPHAEGHYALPCAGTYLVQVGNRPAKKVVVAR